MSVRRLDLVQPESFAFTPANLAWAKKTIGRYPEGKQASAVLPVLWRAQEQNDGWISQPAIEYVAKMLDMATIRVLEVATFYTMFQLSPVGKKAHIQVCGTIACQLRGAEDLKKVCQLKIHPEPHHMNADGSLSWEEVECLGACVNAPMVQVWKETFEDLTPAKLETLIDEWAAGRKPAPGPQINRSFSQAEGEATALSDKSLYNKQRTFKRVEAPPPPSAFPPAPPTAAPVTAVTAVAPTLVAAVAATVVAKVAPPRKQSPRQRLVELVPALKKKAAPRAAKTDLRSAKKSVDGRPELLKTARKGGADDLELIWGVGPSLTKMLNKMGVWLFDQVASWSAAELKWVDENLEGFSGRAKRDEWVKQAKKLAKGWRPDNAVGDKPVAKKSIKVAANIIAKPAKKKKK